MTLKTIPPHEAERMTQAGALLVDVREPDEFARVSIPGSENHPLDRIGQLGPQPVVFLCRSGMRTRTHAAKLASCHQGRAYLLEGGIEGWRKAGLPVAETAGAPIEIMRQVQIAAGALVLLGVLLGIVVSQEWLALAGFVGGGLAFAGITGWCGMARLLAHAPWNRIRV